ncbi:DUF362 domain-containing protein, partial [candidate division WOR-3 bacterium]|nr:DUF362 domain-containing protein [candidate division WOR-3 bacterium]
MPDTGRRDFIKLGIAAAAAALLPRRLLAAPPDAAPSGPLVVVAGGDRTRLVPAAVDALGGIGRFVSPGDKVCIKPNISFAANAECGATTSAEVAAQLVRLCLDAGAAKVILADHTIAEARLCVERSGIEAAVLDPRKVSLVTLESERQFAEVAVPDGRELTSVLVAKVALQSDKLINLPTAKSHSAAGISLGLKNLMGLVWDRGHFHQRNLHRAIAELATVIRPALTVVDATRALVTGGPGGPGRTVTLDKVVAGTDPVAVDACAVGLTQWYGRAFTGRNVKYLVAASELGLGEIDTSRMTIRQVEA